MDVNNVFGPKFVAGAQKNTTRVTTQSGFLSRNFPNAWFNNNAVGRIEGYVYDRIGTTDVPLHRRLFLIRDVDALRMRMKFSDPNTGYYSFDNLEMGFTYSVIAQDTNQTRNAIIKDKIAPLQMT